MAPGSNEICENCLSKENLGRCAGCKVVRYCSKTCQKAHWNEHKPFCLANVRLHNESKAMGPEYSGKLKALGKWCDDFAGLVANCGINALELMKDRERTESFVFVVYIKASDDPKPPYTFTVKDALCMPMEAVYRMYGIPNPSGMPPDVLALVDRQLSPRPKMMRVILLDEVLPWPHTSPFILPKDLAERVYEPRWLEMLRTFTQKSEGVHPSVERLGREGKLGFQSRA